MLLFQSNDLPSLYFWIALKLCNITCWPQLCVWVLHLLEGTLADPGEAGIWRSQHCGNAYEWACLGYVLLQVNQCVENRSWSVKRGNFNTFKYYPEVFSNKYLQKKVTKRPCQRYWWRKFPKSFLKNINRSVYNSHDKANDPYLRYNLLVTAL